MQASRGGPVEGAEPPEVGIKVLGCNTVEAANPVLEATVEGIDVLDVIDASDHTGLGRDIDRAMRHSNLFDGGGQYATAICA